MNPPTENRYSRAGRFYSADNYLRRPGILFRQMLADLASSWELALRLTVRDFKAQFRASYAGYLWAFIPPIVASVTFLVLRAGNVINFPDTEVRYSVFVFVGTLLWQVFTEALLGPIKMITGSRGMLVKVNFPREALLIAGLLLSLINMLIRLIVLLPVLLWLHPPFYWSALLFPLAAASLVLLGYTLGLFLAPIGMLYHDIQRGLTLITTFWMFITPVVFPISGQSWVQTIYRLNPVSPLLQTARDLVTGMPPTLWLDSLIVIGVVLLLLPMAWLLFRIFIPHIIERLGM